MSKCLKKKITIYCEKVRYIDGGKYAIKVTQTGTKSGDGSFGTFSRPSINDNGKIYA